jgi:hypothetical protein
MNLVDGGTALAMVSSDLMMVRGFSGELKLLLSA